MSGNKLMIQRGGSLLHSQFCTRSRAVFPQPLLRTQVSSPFTPNWSHSQPQIPASSSAPLPSHGPTVSLLQLKWHKDSLFFFSPPYRPEKWEHWVGGQGNTQPETEQESKGRNLGIPNDTRLYCQGTTIFIVWSVLFTCSFEVTW